MRAGMPEMQRQRSSSTPTMESSPTSALTLAHKSKARLGRPRVVVWPDVRETVRRHRDSKGRRKRICKGERGRHGVEDGRREVSLW